MDRRGWARKNQDKVVREERIKNRELQDLRSENRRLTKALARARKELAKFQSIVDTSGDEDEVEPMAKLEQTSFVCPKCVSQDIRGIDLNGKSYKICGSCLNRWVV